MEKVMLFIPMAIPGLLFAQDNGGGRIPEPSTMALLASAVAAAGLVYYLKKRRNK